MIRGWVLRSHSHPWHLAKTKTMIWDAKPSSYLPPERFHIVRTFVNENNKFSLILLRKRIKRISCPPHIFLYCSSSWCNFVNFIFPHESKWIFECFRLRGNNVWTPLRLFQYSYLQRGEHVLDFIKDRLHVLNKFWKSGCEQGLSI